MKTITIINLRLLNFKGIDSLTIEPNGDSFSVLGRNAAGKTTLADAWLWLTTGVDSQGHAPGKGFDILRLEDGVPTGAEASVEAAVEIENANGLKSTVVLKKTYRQKLTTSAGDVEPRPTGHTTAHFVDGVPRSQREYVGTIIEIGGELVRWKLLSDPLFFSDSEDFHWSARRTLLLDITGGVDDTDVVADDIDFEDIRKTLQYRTLDDHRAILTARKRELTAERAKIPTRIDEVRRKMPDVGEELAELAEPAALARLMSWRLARREAEADRQRIEGGGVVAAKADQRATLRARIQEAQNEAQEAASEAAEGLRKESEAAARQKSAARMEAERIDGELGAWRDIIVNLAIARTQAQALRDAADEDVFEHADEESCAACDQDLPVEKVETVRARALELFNLGKAGRLEELDLDIERGKRKAAELKKSIEGGEEELAAAETALTEASAAAGEAKRAAYAAPIGLPSDEIMKLRDDVVALDLEVKALKEDRSEALGAAEAKVADLDQSIEGAEATIARFDERRRAEARAEELKAQEVDLARQAEDTERGLWLCDQFTCAKVHLVEAQVSQHFKFASFRLFRERVNGRFEDVCDVLGPDGVPFGSGLNGTQRVLVGLDIIETLQRHYGICLPVWMDDAILHDQLPEGAGQMVWLVKSGDETPRIEKE